MRRRKKITVMIVPEDTSRTFKRSFSYITLYIVLGVVVILVCAFALMIMNYGRIYYKALRSELLERRNANLEEQWHKITRLERELAQLKKTDERVRKMLGADLAPPPPKLPSSEAGIREKGSATPMGGMPQLETEEGTLKTPTVPLDAIPATWPVRGWISRTFSLEHPATDIAAPTGTPIVATISGVVRRSAWDDRYGHIIELENEQGFVTVYGHNSRLLVKEGERVKKGDVIAFLGSTGLSSAPHLHYEIRLNDQPVDPMRYLVP